MLIFHGDYADEDEFVDNGDENYVDDEDDEDKDDDDYEMLIIMMKM